MDKIERQYVEEKAEDAPPDRSEWIRRVHRHNVLYRRFEVAIGAALLGWLGSCIFSG